MLTAAVWFLLAAVSPERPVEVTRARFLMGTVCEITSSSGDQTEAAFAEAARVERELLSTWKTGTELERLNASGSAEVSPELWTLLSVAAQWSERTGGAFNPLVRPLIDCWKTRGAGALPSAGELAAARAKAAPGNLTFPSARSIALLNGAAVEEGAFGKGYALDRMLEAFKGSPAVVLNFGGQIAVSGRTEVTIADPSRRDQAVARLELTDASLSTSSGSERSFTIRGRTFSHILDARSGEALPPRGSVSVIATSGLEADILSTALYVMGTEEGLRWSNAHGVAAAFVDLDRSVHLSHEFLRRADGFAMMDSHFHIKE